MRPSPNRELVLRRKGEYQEVQSYLVGYSRRREAREIAECIADSNRAIKGVTLAHVCAANLVILEVSCHACPRRGRYRVTRLIDRYGSGKPLTELASDLAVGCPKQHDSTSFFQRCGVNFPGWKRNCSG